MKFVREITHETPLRLTPGPFEVSPEVLKAPLKAVIGHRTKEFRDVMCANRAALCAALGVPEDRYFPVIIPGTGTSAMEAMVDALVPGRKPLVLVNGRFSRRLADISIIHNSSTTVLDFGTGSEIDVSRIENFLESNSGIDLILFGIQDTREAILNPFSEICDLAKRHRMLIGVDGISAFVCETIDPLALGIDCFTESSGKGIRGLAGLGIVCAKNEFLENLNPNNSRSYYLNLARHFQSQKEKCEPLFADSAALHFSLHQALVELLEEGVQNRRAVIQKRTRLVRERMQNMGLRFLRSEDRMPNSATSILLPEILSFREFQSSLQRQGVLVYAGSSSREDCFQIGTAGYLTDEVLEIGLDRIKGIVRSFL